MILPSRAHKLNKNLLQATDYRNSFHCPLSSASSCSRSFCFFFSRCPVGWLHVSFLFLLCTSLMERIFYSGFRWHGSLRSAFLVRTGSSLFRSHCHAVLVPDLVLPECFSVVSRLNFDLLLLTSLLLRLPRLSLCCLACCWSSVWWAVSAVVL